LPDAEVALLVTDKPAAYAVERAARLNIPVFSFEPKAYPDKAAFETEIVKQLKQNEIELVVLAGYMRLVGPVLLAEYEGRIINLHPSLLPAFPGKDAVGQALAYGVKVTGATVHFVDAGLDSGPIIAQVPVEVEQTDTADSLAARIHQVEHDLLVKAIRDIIAGRVAVNGRIVRVTK
jgi:phosphoribosylglycinamide formyltransferase-1